jgi:hypothetical protein
MCCCGVGGDTTGERQERPEGPDTRARIRAASRALLHARDGARLRKDVPSAPPDRVPTAHVERN